MGQATGVRDRETLKALFEGLPNGLIVGDERGRVLGANGEALRLLGLQSADLEENGWCGPEWRFFRFDGLPLAQEEHPGSTALAKGAPVAPLALGLKLGRSDTAWVQVAAAPLEGRQVALTIQPYAPPSPMPSHQASQGLLESEARFATMFQLVPVSVSVTARDTGRILAVNRAFNRVLGYEEGEVEGRTTIEIGLWRDPAQRPRVMALLEHSEGRASVELLARSKDGRSVRLMAYLEPVDIDGLPCLLSTALDITERRRAEEDREALKARMVRAEKMRSLGRLAGGIAHDMNNVLGAVLGLGCVGLQEVVPGKLQESLDAIVRACLLGRDTVRRLMEFSGHHLHEQEPLDLNHLVSEVLRLLEHTGLHRVHVDLDLFPMLPPVLGDAASLSHACLNLCVNALDAMPNGGSLRIRTSLLDDDHVELEIIDTGCGMAPDVLRRATDPYFTTKPAGKGTGLGLPQVYGTVQSHRGEMEMESTPGQGTTIRLRFPIHRVPPPCSEEAVPQEALSTRPLRLLLVDDDELLQFALRIQLGHLGHSVIVATHADEAQASLEAGLEVDAIVLDVNEADPGMARALAQLRTTWPHLPILVISGWADPQAEATVAAHPPAGVLDKPFTLAELKTRLDRLVLAASPA